MHMLLYPNKGEQTAWSGYPFISAKDRYKNKYISQKIPGMKRKLIYTFKF